MFGEPDRPMKTSEIFEMMGPIREEIGGSDKKGNLSAMMHHSPLFVSHGRVGWTLAEDEKGSTPASDEQRVPFFQEQIERGPAGG